MKDLIDFYSEHEQCYAATLELCTTCNWQCKHCYLPKHANSGLPTHSVKQIIEQLRAFGVYELSFTGGEIFTREDCMELITYARRLGIAVCLLSNGSLISKEQIEQLAMMHIEHYACTIFSMNPEIHDKFVEKENALNDTLRNILLMKKHGIHVLVKCILTKYNWESYKEVKEFCERNSIEFLFTTSIYSKRNGSKDPLSLTVSEDALEEIIRETTVNDGFFYKGITNDGYVCHTARYHLFIDAEGNIYPCGNYMKYVGNALTDSFEKAWNNIELKTIRDRKIKDTKCRDCHLRERCSACVGINEQINGDPLSYWEDDCQAARLREKYFSH